MSAIIKLERRHALGKLRMAMIQDSRTDDLTYVIGVGGRYLCHFEDESKYCPFSWEDTHIYHAVSNDYVEARELIFNHVFKGTADTAFILDTETDSIVAAIGKWQSIAERFEMSSYIRQSWIGINDAMDNDRAEMFECPSTFLFDNERSAMPLPWY